jgi:polygalacturonase
MENEAVPKSVVFNVRDFGASGNKDENAQSAIQAAIDACAASGGGMVYFPPGAYSSGTLHLRSHVRIHIESGATLYSSKDPSSFEKRALFYADGVENITLEGRGTVHGQAEYEHRLMGDFKDWYIYPNQKLAEKAGIPLMRSFPTENSVGHLVLLLRCKDVQIHNLSFLHSPSWTMHLYACERLVIDGVYIHTSLQDGVWADGIDPDGCKDVRISNCTIETGDDAIVFYSVNIYGPALPCENITITNCRLSSASSALKFCDGNQNAIRNVTIDNCVITGSNRGIAFMVFDGGVIENVVLSNLTVECKPFDWFWWGDSDPLHFNLIQRSEIDENIEKSTQPPVGTIRNVTIRNVIARGPGPCKLHGSIDSPLENITLENLRLTVVEDPQTILKKGGTALTLENALNFHLKDVVIDWEGVTTDLWKTALLVQDTRELTLDGVSARQAQDGGKEAAIVLRNVAGARILNCKAQSGTGVFLDIQGAWTDDLLLLQNDTRKAQIPLRVDGTVKQEAVKA